MNFPKIYKIRIIDYNRVEKNSKKIKYFIIPYKDDEHILYFPLRGVVCTVNEQFINKIKSDDKVVKMLFDMVKKYKRAKIIKRKHFEDSITLELTSACNLNCIYCYAHGGDKPKYMDWKTAKAGIDYALKKCKGGEFNISFHGGGEPLLAFDMMKKCYEYAKKKCDKKEIKIRTTVATNGTLIRDDVAKWMKKVNISLMVSFDGTPEIQNKQRPFRDGSGSYKTVRNAIELLNKYKINYRTQTTVTGYSINKMSTILKHLHKLGVKRCGFAIIWECGRCIEKCIIKPNDIIFNKAVKKLKRLANKYKIQIYIGGEDVLNTDGLYIEPCNGTGHALVITADGNISSCMTITNKNDPVSNYFFYGKIVNGKVIVDKKKLDKLRKRTVENLKQCKDCFIKYYCLGDCPANCARETKSLYKIPQRDCELNKIKGKEFLIDILK